MATTILHAHDDSLFGHKSIDFIGSLCLLYNNITGSGMVLFPLLYQICGYLPVTLLLIILTIYTLLCSIMIFECMSAIQHNNQFQSRIEYTTLCKYYFKPINYQITQLFYQISLLTTNITTIIQSISVCDYALIALFKSTCAIQIYPTIDVYCISNNSNINANTDSTPFDSSSIVLSTGMLLCGVLCIPLGLFNLDDNIYIQKLSCIGVISICIIWCILFNDIGFDINNIPIYGNSMIELFGVCIFNYAMITTLPSWVNEKRNNVSIMYTLIISLLAATGSFICIGVLGGLALTGGNNNNITDIHNSDNLLVYIYNMNNVIATITYYIWPIVVNFTSIPIFSIIMRYNLIENNVCNKHVSTFISVFLPWLISIVLYTGSGFTYIVTFSGLIVNSVVNFVIPPLLYIHYANNTVHGNIDIHSHNIVQETKEKLSYSDIENNVLHETTQPLLANDHHNNENNNEIDSIDNYNNNDYNVNNAVIQHADRWYIVPDKYNMYRVPVALFVVSTMTVMCTLAVIVDIIYM